MTDLVIPAPVAALVDAINAADTDAFVAAFIDDGFVALHNRGCSRGLNPPVSSSDRAM